MKILKLLNKNYLTIFIISIFFLINPLNAEDEPIDIWELETKAEPDENQLILEEDNSTSNSIIQIETDLNTKINTLKKESLKRFLKSYSYSRSAKMKVGGGSWHEFATHLLKKLTWIFRSEHSVRDQFWLVKNHEISKCRNQ